MGKMHTFEDGSVLDLDDDIDIDDLPEGEDDLSEEEFAGLLAEAEAEEVANSPDPDEVEEEPDGVEVEDL